MGNMDRQTGFTSIRNLSFDDTRIVAGNEGCADSCYEWPGCDCQPGGSPDSGRAGYNLGLALERWLVMF